MLEGFRALGWDNARLHDASPFRVVDPGFNAILVRSCADLARLAEALGEPEIAAANRERAARGLAALPPARLTALAARLDTLAERTSFPVPSHDPLDPRFDAKRYWRGPAWLIVNYLIADGLRAGGESAAAERVERASIGLIERGGFAEYYDPVTGEPCGGGSFTWTAAMVMEILRAEPATT